MSRLFPLAGVLLLAAGVTFADPELDPRFIHVTPTLSEFQPDIPWGGRVNDIAVHPRDARQIVAATESGGLFRSTDGGEHWTHLDRLPSYRTRRVAYLGDDGLTLVVTTGRDFKLPGGGGIWRSVDGGVTWEKPASSVPPPGPKCTARPSGYGLSISPDDGTVYVATDCGVSSSDDDGASWNHVELPYERIPGDHAQPIFTSVEALGGGRLLVGGFTGIWRSDDGGEHWTQSTPGVGRIVSTRAFSRSPLVPTYAYVVNGETRLFVSADAGVSWSPIESAPTGGGGCGGIEFVRSLRAPLSPLLPPRPTEALLYFGNRCGLVRLRVPYSSATGTFDHSGTWQEMRADHADTRVLAFDAARRPRYLGTDGGFHTTRDGGSTWQITGGGAGGLNAVQITEVAGQKVGEFRRYDLYFATQDNDLWSSTDNGRTWDHRTGAEGFHLQLERRVASAADTKVTYVVCAGCNTVTSDANFRNQVDWPDPQPGFGSPVFVARNVHIQHSPASDTAAQGVSITDDLGATWRAFVEIPEEFRELPKLSGRSSDPVFYQAIRTGVAPDGNEIMSLARVSRFRIDPRGTLTYPSMTGFGGLGTNPTMFAWYKVFAVDPTDPMHLLAPDALAGAMKESWDGGETWLERRDLTDLVTHGGTLAFTEDDPWSSGPYAFPIVTAISFYPENPNFVLLGTSEGGVYFSKNRGAAWERIWGSERATYVTSIHWQSDTSAIVSTYGRGLWKVQLHIRSAIPHFEPLCDLPCLAFDPWDLDVLQPIPKMEGFDRILLVFGGQLTGAWAPGGVLRRLSVAPGASWLLFSDDPKARIAVDDSGRRGLFPGLPAARKLADSGLVLRGLALQGNKVRYVIASKEPGNLAVPGPVVPFEDKGQPTSGIDGQPYVWLSSAGVFDGTPLVQLGGTLEIRGRGFGAGSQLPLEVTVDGQPVQGVFTPTKDGDFRAKVRIDDLAIGVHQLRVTQKLDAQTVFSDASSFIVPHEDEFQNKLPKRRRRK